MSRSFYEPTRKITAFKTCKSVVLRIMHCWRYDRAFRPRTRYSEHFILETPWGEKMKQISKKAASSRFALLVTTLFPLFSYSSSLLASFLRASVKAGNVLV